MSYIKDKQLRKEVIQILKFKTRNKVVREIQEGGDKFHQYHIDRFIAGEDVKLSTLKKLNEYVKKQTK